MKINFESSLKKQYIEILPTIDFSWYREKTLYFGWLFWNVTIIK